MAPCSLYPMKATGAFPALILKTPIFGIEPTTRMFNNGDFTHRRSHVDLMSFNNSILLLKALIEAEDQVARVCKAADDCLYKPFDLGQLLTRVDLFCRRGYGKHASITKAGDLRIGNDAHTTCMPLAILTKESSGNTQQPSIFPNRMILIGSDPI